MKRRFAQTFALGCAAILTAMATFFALPAERLAARRAATVMAYYAPYDARSWQSLATNAAHIDYLAAQWVEIDACAQLRTSDDQTVKRFSQATGVTLLPSLYTISPWLNGRLLNEPALAAAAIENILAYVREEDYRGFDLDLEGVAPADRDAFTTFVARLADALHADGRILTLAIPAKTSDARTGWGGAYDYVALGKSADLITIMSYEYSGAWGPPGPIAPFRWVGQVMGYAAAAIPPERALLGLAWYGYEWNVPRGNARLLGHAEAERIAGDAGAAIGYDDESQSSTARFAAPAAPLRQPTYTPPGDHEVTTRSPSCAVTEPTPDAPPRPTPTPGRSDAEEHVVWVEDRRGAAARLHLADHLGVGGVSAWRLGLEDPGVWPVIAEWRARTRP